MSSSAPLIFSSQTIFFVVFSERNVKIIFSVLFIVQFFGGITWIQFFLLLWRPLKYVYIAMN